MMEGSQEKTKHSCEFKLSRIAGANYHSKAKVNINQGGTSSGKTYSLLMLLLVYAMTEKMVIITVCGQDIPNLKKGAWRDIKRILASYPDVAARFAKPNESERTLTCIETMSIIEFSSFSDEQDARSGKRDYLFVNEANGIPYEIYWQLAIRTSKKIFIDFNPTAHFWAHDLIGKDNVVRFISDHRDNEYLTDEQHKEIESIEDPELFKVYARGETGQIRGTIFNNWVIADEMPTTFHREWGGGDFGFTNDPTAMYHVGLVDGELWVDELCYETGLTNPEIAQRIKDEKMEHLHWVFDSAEQKSITELRNLGIRNIEGANKGSGDEGINNGIATLKRYKIHITRRSVGLRKEAEKYVWKVNKLTGETTNKPIDAFNHGWDAIRYVALNYLQTPNIKKGARRAAMI